jgi:hypothetical protein
MATTDPATDSIKVGDFEIGKWEHDCSDGTNDVSLSIIVTKLHAKIDATGAKALVDKLAAAIGGSLGAKADAIIGKLKKLVPSGSADVNISLKYEPINKPCKSDPSKPKVLGYKIYLIIQVSIEAGTPGVTGAIDLDLTVVLAEDEVKCKCPEVKNVFFVSLESSPFTIAQSALATIPGQLLPLLVGRAEGPPSPAEQTPQGGTLQPPTIPGQTLPKG